MLRPLSWFRFRGGRVVIDSGFELREFRPGQEPLSCPDRPDLVAGEQAGGIIVTVSPPSVVIAAPADPNQSRGIAAGFSRPESTVRRWLRAAREPHAQLLAGAESLQSSSRQQVSRDRWHRGASPAAAIGHAAGRLGLPEAPADERTSARGQPCAKG